MAASISQAALFSTIMVFLLSLHCSSTGALGPVEKKTHLHFYFHEIIAGANATLLQVVNPPNSTEFMAFGAIAVLDDMLKDGQEENSKLIGRAQGIVGAAGKDGSVATMLNFVFTEGKYNGSTLAIYGRVVPGEPIERPVVGGTGLFRMARGYSIGIPLVASATKFVYEFNVYVWHNQY